MNKYYYEFERVNAYCYPDSFVLRNKLNIQDGVILNALERELTSTRIQQALEFPVKGKFDLKHLCAIHEFIFSDIYDWAGELRTVNIAKGNQFCNYLHLETYAAGFLDKLKAEKWLTKTPPDIFPERLTYYFSEVNVLHPFREGNGRVQRIFTEYLAQAAGWHLDYSDVSDFEMIEASALAFALEYDKMEEMLRRITTPISDEEKRAFRVKIGLSRPAKNE
jgi:cell filamentation protein